MGFRKSYSSGPMRMTLSRSGVSVSAGIGGVRVGHYASRSRSRSRSSSGDSVWGILLLLGIGVLYGIYLLLAAVATFVAEHWPFFVGGMVLLGAGAVALIVRGRLRSKRVNRLVEAAVALCNDPDVDPATFASVRELRRAAAPLPSAAEQELAEAYGNLISNIVLDGLVEPRELEQLAAAEQALELSQEVIQAARKQGFLEVYRAAIADDVLTTEEEQSLSQVRQALGVPADHLAKELELAEQLARARQVRESEPSQIEVSTKLRKDETCYYKCNAVDLKRQVLRSGGERSFTFEPARTGSLYMTNQRLLFVAEGTTTVKLDVILDVKVDVALGQIVVTKDGRKTPYYFGVDEPFIAVAYLEQAMKAQ